MADVQVLFVIKRPSQNAHEGISHLGSLRWCWTRAQVINSIEEQRDKFFTLVNNKQALLTVVNDRNGKYLRTYADNTPTDNLLELPSPAPDLPVTCVLTSSLVQSHEHITHIGGVNWCPGYANWCWPEQQVIELIETNTRQFHTLKNGKHAVIRVVSNLNRKYLRTYADNTPTDNLLELPGCAI